MHSAVVLKTVEILQLQFLDLVVVPVLCNDKCWYRQCRKLWNCRRYSSCGVVDVAVIIQRLFQQSSRTVVARFSSFDRVLDIPVVPQQFLNKDVDASAHGSYNVRQWFTDKVVDIPVHIDIT